MYVDFVLCRDAKVSEYGSWIRRTSGKPVGMRLYMKMIKSQGSRKSPLGTQHKGLWRDFSKNLLCNYTSSYFAKGMV
jgi:hypothetical protein